MSMTRLIFFFLPYISFGILENNILFAFFLHFGVATVALTKHQKFGQFNNQPNVFGYVILIWWIIPNRKGLKATIKKLPPLKNTWEKLQLPGKPLPLSADVQKLLVTW